MNISRRVVVGSTIACCMIVLGLAAPSVFASKKDNFNACLTEGGSVKACCAGVGGTYDKQPGGEVCSWVENKVATDTGSDPGNGYLHFRPPTGVDISSVMSDGRSQAGVNGLQQEVVNPDLIIQAITFTPTAESPDAYTVTVKNWGASTADLTNVAAQGYYSTTVGTWPTNDPACGSTFNAGTTLAPGATIDLPVGCSYPPGPSDAWLVVKIDFGDALTESDETNNITSVGLAPDLIINAMYRTPTQGLLQSYTVTVKNQGASTADLTNVAAQGYYSTTEGTWPTNDPACGSTFNAGTTLAPGATIDLVVGCTIDSNYQWLVVKIDFVNVLIESDENNNIFSLDVLQLQ
jgi:hypothetical protein